MPVDAPVLPIVVEICPADIMFPFHPWNIVDSEGASYLGGSFPFFGAIYLTNESQVGLHHDLHPSLLAHPAQPAAATLPYKPKN